MRGVIAVEKEQQQRLNGEREILTERYEQVMSGLNKEHGWLLVGSKVQSCHQQRTGTVRWKWNE